MKQKRSSILQNRRQPSPIRAQDRHLFISERTGDKIDISTLQTAMQTLTTIAKDQAQKDGVEFNPFTFHDLKRKGISNTEASERMAAAGHRSPEMMKVYDVKPTKN